MASFICCQRLGCAICCGSVELRAGPAAFGASIAGGEDPEVLGEFGDFTAGDLLESLGDVVAPGALVVSVAALVASLIAGLVSESRGVAGIDCIETASCGGD